MCKTDVVVCRDVAEKRIIEQYRRLQQQQDRRRPFTLIIHNNGSTVQLSQAVNLGMVRKEDS